MIWGNPSPLTYKNDGGCPFSGHIKEGPDQFLALPHELGCEGGSSDTEQGGVSKLASQSPNQHRFAVSRRAEQEEAPTGTPKAPEQIRPL